MLTQEKYTTINTNEEIVKVLTLDMMKKSGVCCCNKCLAVACAATLGQLDEERETTENAFPRSGENKIDLLLKVTRAVEDLKANRLH